MKTDIKDKIRVTHYCRACGSQNLVRDAETRWSKKKQKWKVKALIDSFYCVDCEWTGEYCDTKVTPWEDDDVSSVQTILPPLPES